MIKVVVVVAGLALVEAPRHGRHFDVYFPEANGFVVPAPSLKDPDKPKRLLIDDHQVDAYLGVSSNGKEKSKSDVSRFRFEIGGATGVANPKEIASFPDFGQVVAGGRAKVRSECGFDDPSPFWNCKGVDKGLNRRRLLSGQIRLSGNWTLLAFETREKEMRVPRPMEGKMASKVRLLHDDGDNPVEHPNYDWNWPRQNATEIRFADTFVFETTVSDLSEISFGGSTKGLDDFLDYAPSAGLEEICGADPCRVLWLENVAPCKSKADPDCEATSDYFAKLDAHLPHVYRLLSTYDPETGMFADQIFTTWGEHLGHSHHVDDPNTENDSSPRCYGGVVQP